MANKDVVNRVCEAGACTATDVELLGLIAGSEDKARELLATLGGRLSQVLGTADYATAARLSRITPSAYARIGAVMELARRSLAEEMHRRDSLTSPAAVRGYLRLQMQALEHECFYCVFLDAQNRVIAAEQLFRGTLTQTSVYPREVVKRSLHHNAAAVILAHNHPSGVAEPSIQDQALTRTLAEALALVDVKVLDHFIVAPGACQSFAERGLI
jgi:DNA repair protein RadC